jgi:hypothetical protein
LLIDKATSPYKSSNPDKVIKKLQEWYKEKPSLPKFIVFVSSNKNRGFGFLQESMIWSWKGHVINLLLIHTGKKTILENSETFRGFSLIEKITFLKYYLETDGAFILKLAHLFTQEKSITLNFLKEKILSIFYEILDNYLINAVNFRERSYIKRLREGMNSQLLNKRDYEETTKTHKIKPHIEALQDLGIIKINRKETNEIYTSQYYGNNSAMYTFYKTCINISNMETLFTNDKYFEIISEIYNLKPQRFSSVLHNQILLDSIFWSYKNIKEETTGLADIEAIFDWCIIKLLADNNVLVYRTDIMNLLSFERKKNPSNIIYNLDGKGNIAYVILKIT